MVSVPPSVPEIVQRFMGVAGIGDLVPAAGGKARKLLPVPIKANSSQPPAGIVQRIRQNKAERHRA